jgi:hypothetical protein
LDSNVSLGLWWALPGLLLINVSERNAPVWGGGGQG